MGFSVVKCLSYRTVGQGFFKAFIDTIAVTADNIAVLFPKHFVGFYNPKISIHNNEALPAASGRGIGLNTAPQGAGY